MLVRRPNETRRNPFRFGDVATGEHFTERKAEIAELVRDLRSGQHVLVMSPRRYAKTSLITAVMDRLRKQHVQVAYVDLLRTTTKERFANQPDGALYEGLMLESNGLSTALASCSRVCRYGQRSP